MRGLSNRDSKGRNAGRDLTGQRIGIVTVLEPTGENDSSGYRIWRARCDCGTILTWPSYRFGRGPAICRCATRAQRSALREGRVTRRATPEEEALLLTTAYQAARRYPRQHLSEGWDGDDLVGEALLAAWRAFQSYDPAAGTSLSTWVTGACRNAIREAFRQCDPLSRSERAHYRAQSQEDPNTESPRQVHSMPTLDEAFAPEERLEERVFLRITVAGALQELPERTRKIVLMIAVGEWSNGAVAAHFGISHSRVTQIYQGALRKLKPALEDAL